MQLYNLFKEIQKDFSFNEIAQKLNVAVGTVKRWEDKKQVPQSYQFDLMKIANKEIDYTNFSYKDKDQFYTPASLAKECVDITYDILSNYINLNDYIFIEPSAGDGIFLQYLPDNTIALDIESNNDKVIIQDYLTDWKPLDLTKKYIVIGNPPFGLRGQKALQFINKSFEFADFICFILPPLFNSDGKGSPKKRINQNLIYSTDINNYNYIYPNNETVNINTIFQIWTKLDLGINLIDNYEPIGYDIYSLSDGGTPSTTRNKDKLYICNYYLPSTVFGNNKMKLYDNFEDLPQRRGYGIITKDKDINNIIEKINWEKIAFRSTNNALNLRTSLIIKAIECLK